jgi:hypothetical protein
MNPKRVTRTLLTNKILHMNQDKFTSLIDSLTESVNTDYKLDDSFDHYNAVIEICASCDYSFVYGKAWSLVDYVRFQDRDLFDEVEREVQENDHNTDDIKLSDYMLTYAFQILKVSTLKKWEEMQLASK